MCGAPLRLELDDTSALCVYCDAPIIVHHTSHGESQLSEDLVLGREAAAQIKKLLASGQHALATALYAHKTGASPAQADQAIASLSQYTSIDIAISSTLNALGMSTMLGMLGLIGVGAWVFIVNQAGWGLGVAPPALLFLFLFRRQIVRTIRYLWSARIGQAKVLHEALLSEELDEICIVKLDLEVHGPDGDRFEVERHFRVKKSALSKIQRGQMLQVKYLQGQPESVLPGRGLDSTLIR